MIKDITKMDIMKLEEDVRDFLASKKYAPTFTITLHDRVMPSKTIKRLEFEATLLRDSIDVNERHFNVTEVVTVYIAENGNISSSDQVWNYPSKLSYKSIMKELKVYIETLLGDRFCDL